MEVLTREQITKYRTWRKEHGDKFAKYDGRRLYFSHPETAIFAIATPKKVSELPRYVRCLATLGYEERILLELMSGLPTQGSGMRLKKALGINFSKQSMLLQDKPCLLNWLVATDFVLTN